jgi:transposase-like protein
VSHEIKKYVTKQKNWSAPPKSKQKRDGEIYFSLRGVIQMKSKYSDEFKLAVIKDYYESTLGVRAIATKYHLPSKNYVNKWEAQLKKKGLLPQDATKPVKSVARSKESILRCDTRTPREKQYEEEIQYLKARVAYYESLDSMQRFLKKN